MSLIGVFNKLHVEASAVQCCRRAARIKLGRMQLMYLDFDLSDDADERCNFDALAAPPAPELPAVRAEVQAVLDWARAEFGPPVALDDGGDWDYALQEANDGQGQSGPRQEVSLSLAGSARFAEAFRQHFELG